MNHPLDIEPWGPWVGVYIVLTGLASGMTLATRFLRPADQRAATRLEWFSSWASLATLGVCTVILIVDLQRPERFFLMVTQFANAGSLMSWGAKIIALKIGLLAVHLMLLHKRQRALAAGDATLAGCATRAVYSFVPDALALVSFALAIYPAFLLSWTWSSPAAHNAGAALIYLSSSAILGIAGSNLIMVLAPGIADPTLGERARASLVRMIAAHAVALGFTVLSLRASGSRAVYDKLWYGVWAGASAVLVVATCMAVVLGALTVLTSGARARIALSVTAMVGAVATRYLIFAVR